MGTEKGEQTHTHSLGKVLGSVLASMFGVQSTRKRVEDFTHGKPYQYILVGLVVTVVFILTIWGVVRLVMGLSGF